MGETPRATASGGSLATTDGAVVAFPVKVNERLLDGTAETLGRSVGVEFRTTRVADDATAVKLVAAADVATVGLNGTAAVVISIATVVCETLAEGGVVVRCAGVVCCVRVGDAVAVGVTVGVAKVCGALADAVVPLHGGGGTTSRSRPADAAPSGTRRPCATGAVPSLPPRRTSAMEFTL